MHPRTTIAGISGSLRRGSFNRRLLATAAYALPPGATLEIWDGLEHVPVATMSASPTPRGAAWAQENLRRVLNVIGADVTGGELAVRHVFRQFDDAGRLADPEVSSRLTDLLGELTGRLAAEPSPS